MSNSTIIPSASASIVQNLKEVVNCSEAEIYAMLKECNMDPSEAVHRLLDQDTFHEVKSKRKKKKETKDGPEFVTQSVNNYHAQSGARGRNSSCYYTSTDYRAGYGKPIQKKANETYAIGNSPSCHSTPTVRSEASSIQNKPHSHSTVDNDVPVLLSQPSGFQNDQSKPMIPSQMSVADTVGLGSSPIKPSTISTDADPIRASLSQIKKPSIISTPHGDSVAHNEEKSQCSTHNDRIWITHEENSSIYQSAFSTSHAWETSKFEQESYLDENQIHVDAYENSQTESNRSESSYDEDTEKDNSRNSGDQDDNPLSGIVSYNSHRHEAEDTNLNISSAIVNLQQLNLSEESYSHTASTEDKPAVIIPSHLQVTNADISHLSFGSFSSNIINATPFGSFPSNHQRNNNFDMAPVMEETKPDHLNSRNTRYCDGDRLRPMIDEKATNTTIYDIPEVADGIHGMRGNFLSSTDYAFPSTAQPSPTYNYPDLNSQIRNLSPFSSLMVKSEVLSSQQPTQQTIPSNIHHPSLTQHLPMHRPQPSVPSGHSTNMTDYPFLTQGDANIAAAAPRKYDNLLPQYQRGISRSNLTQSSAFPLGYEGSNGTSRNNLRDYYLNPSNTLGGTTVGFSDALSLRHNDESHFIPVQHEKSDRWLEGGSRGDILTVLGSKSYSLQSRQSAFPAFRQASRQHAPPPPPPPQHSQMEYLNFYRSQGRPSRLQQQEDNMRSPQGRIWHHDR